MDVGLHHRGVDAHAAAFSQAMALCHGHHPDVDLFDHVCPQCHAPAPHGLGVRGLAGAHAGEVAVQAPAARAASAWSNAAMASTAAATKAMPACSAGSA